MTIDHLKATIEELPEVEFRELMSWVVGAERQRRATARATAQAEARGYEAGQAVLLEQLRESGQLPPDAVIPAIPLVPAQPITPETPEEDVPEGDAPEQEGVVPAAPLAPAHPTPEQDKETTPDEHPLTETPPDTEPPADQ